MSTSIIQSLEQVLVERDETIRQLREQIEALKGRLDRSSHDWHCPREILDDANLPLPRLEMVWTDISEEDDPPWTSRTVEYRLVHRHYLGMTKVIPMGLTRIRGGSGIPWKMDNEKPDLPLRDGVHACFDAPHLNLPLYVVASGETMKVDTFDYCPSAFRKGESARRA